MVYKDVLFEYDVDCEWHDKPPRYRLWVNDELFTERTWIWRDDYLEETVAVHAPPGTYNIRYELIGEGKIIAARPRVLEGPGEFVNDTTLRIQ